MIHLSPFLSFGVDEIVLLHLLEIISDHAVRFGIVNALMIPTIELSRLHPPVVKQNLMENLLVVFERLKILLPYLFSGL